MTPSAKAAQQIARKIYVRACTCGVDYFSEDKAAEIIEQALSDSLRPYRELVKYAQHLENCHYRQFCHSFDSDGEPSEKYPTGCCYQCGENELHMNHVLENRACSCGLEALIKEAGK